MAIMEPRLRIIDYYRLFLGREKEWYFSPPSNGRSRSISHKTAHSIVFLDDGRR